MKKIATTLLITISLIMAIFIMPPSTYAVVINGEEQDDAGYFQSAISDLFIMVGDFAVNMINEIVGEQVTMQKIVFNGVTSLDPNFYNKNLADTNETTAILREQINKWYNFFYVLAIATYLIVFLVFGIKVVLGATAGGLEKAKELSIKWLTGVCILCLFPSLVIKNAFKLNEAIVKMIADANTDPTVQGGFGTSQGEWSNEEIEFRSPEYVSRFTGVASYSGGEMNILYQKALDNYRSGADMTRVMRAYAGITKQFVYVMIWYVLLTQLIVLLVKYYKRYFIIAVLIIIFPLVCMYYIIEIARGKGGQVFSTWAKELMINIFIQSVHAITYAIIASVAISRVREDITTQGDSMNWIIIIVAINFITEGEKIIRKIIGANASTVGGIGETGKAMRANVQHAAGNIKSAIPHKK